MIELINPKIKQKVSINTNNIWACPFVPHGRAIAPSPHSCVVAGFSALSLMRVEVVRWEIERWKMRNRW
jgi:hypothetical protein